MLEFIATAIPLFVFFFLTKKKKNLTRGLLISSLTCFCWQDHYVIDMFWEVLKSFTQENQMKFLK